MARFNANGAFDTSFDGDGRLSTAISSTTSFLSDVGDDIHVLGDGRILVGAYSDDGTDNGAGTVISQNNFAALRYSTTGALDTSFSGDGIGEYDFSQNDTFDAMVVDPTGRPVLVGYSYVAGQFVDPKLAAARVTTTGALDTSFNGTGTFFKPLQGSSVDLAAGIARQSTGKLVGGRIDRRRHQHRRRTRPVWHQRDARHLVLRRWQGHRRRLRSQRRAGGRHGPDR